MCNYSDRKKFPDRDSLLKEMERIDEEIEKRTEKNPFFKFYKDPIHGY